MPCVRKVETGTRFCRRHEDAVVGAMLGALVQAEKRAGAGLTASERRERSLSEEAERERRKRNPARELSRKRLCG